MRFLRRAARCLTRLAACVFLGVGTTLVVSSAIGAFLPPRGLWEFHGSFTATREPSHRIRVVRYGRTGMARRSWYPDIPGESRLGSALSWEWDMASGVVTRQLESRANTADANLWTIFSRVDFDASDQWGTLGQLARGERDQHAEATEDARGWPRLAFWCEIRGDRSNQGGCTVEGGIRRPTKSTTVGTVRCIPLRPIWDGLIFDTTLYGAAWGTLLLRIPVTRRTIRRARGKCPRCAYDLEHGFTAGCPECGWNKPPKLPA